MKLIADAFQRQMLVTEFKKWMMYNIQIFI